MKIDKIYKKILVLLPVLTLVLVPATGAAETDVTRSLQNNPPITGLSDVERLFKDILSTTNTIFWVIATIFILYAAFLYLSAQGSEEKVKKAKNMLVYAVIAVTIALFAAGLDELIYNILSQKST